MLQKISAFVFLLSVWIVFSGKISVDVLIIGSAVSLLVTLFFSDMLFREVHQNFSGR